MKKFDVEKIAKTGLKVIGVGTAAVALAIGLNGCQPEPKIVYNNIPCEDPTHGPECNPDNHPVVGHSCDENCNHDLVPCMGEYDCYDALTKAFKSVREEIEGQCAENNCINPNNCMARAKDKFVTTAFDLAIQGKRPAHKINNDIIGINGVANDIYSGNTFKITPCTTPNIREAAQQAATTIEHY